VVGDAITGGIAGGTVGCGPACPTVRGGAVALEAGAAGVAAPAVARAGAGGGDARMTAGGLAAGDPFGVLTGRGVAGAVGVVGDDAAGVVVAAGLGCPELTPSRVGPDGAGGAPDSFPTAMGEAEIASLGSARAGSEGAAPASAAA
jgi:hypothetical protein